MTVDHNTLPARAGISLKPMHFQAMLTHQPDLGFVEIHAENYMVDGGPYHFYLQQIYEQYPLSIHGVGLSIGGLEPLDKNHLNRLKVLLDRYPPARFSEHLAWSSHQGVYFNDLLPLAYTDASLQRVCEHIDQVQQALGRQMLLENPSTYVESQESTWRETDFMQAAIERTGCGLLLDVNNIYVSSVNHHQDPVSYLQALPYSAAGEIHLAGFAVDQDVDGSPLLIDSHDRDISDEVWSLYDQALSLCGPVATLIERDGNVPALDVLCAEAQMAEQRLLSIADISRPKVASYAG
ncbi:hypothetical protein BGP77_14815 [Saccharospirillum sp. MSK14-1]|uniref:MNIO family bufferin maturase n=1 Tax=Saccharospirillum sp. MSK14-1 TaxID=1897632 RepID=UPI000D3DC652|nr:DUF692 domain-containing protein [Saccharospirillum sp. MSK14-1]PTY37750.1 hypothetical protein BGP77_14815 [Saccharospirillum sp. MSK14-1]